MTKNSLIRTVFVIASSILLTGLLYPTVFGQAHQRTANKGGVLAQTLSEKNQQMSKTFQSSLSRKDYVTAERTLQEWGSLPGVFGKSPGYWICMVHLRNQQKRYGEAADAYKELYKFQGTLQTSPGFLSDWALASSRDGRRQEVYNIYDLVASTPTWQQDTNLNRIQLGRLASDPKAVEAISEMLTGRTWLARNRYDLAEKALQNSVALRPDLFVSHLLLAQTLRQHNKKEEAQRVLDTAEKQAHTNEARLQVKTEQRLLDASKPH